MEQTFNRINTGNLVIDSFVSNYMMLAEHNNIVFKTNIKVDLDNIQISDYDFSISEIFWIIAIMRVKK